MKSVDDMLKEQAVPVIVLDKEGVITFVNEAFEKEYGWKKSELLKASVYVIIPTALRQAHNIGFSRFLSTETPTLLEKPLRLPILCKDGQQRDAEHVIVADKQEGAWRFAATIRPLDGV